MRHEFQPSTILSSSDESELAAIIASLALEFAVLGYFDIAKQLVILLDENTPFYDEMTMNLRPMRMLWHSMDDWPEEDKKRVKDVSDYESKRDENWIASEDSLKDRVARFKDVEDPDGGGFEQGQSIVDALEIAMVLEEENNHPQNELPDVQKLMGLAAIRFVGQHAQSMIKRLAESSTVWKLLKAGYLARAIGVNDEKVYRLGKIVLEACEQRFQQGLATNGMWEKSIPRLLRIISHNSVNGSGPKGFFAEYYGAEDEHGYEYPTKILREPLSADGIAALESRLGVSLPSDYKEFLATTNGMDESWGGILMEPPLHRADTVKWDNEPELVLQDLQAELLLIEIFQLMDEAEFEAWPKIGVSLRVGDLDVFNVCLLPPVKVKEVTQAYLNLRKKSKDIQEVVDRGIEKLAGSVEEFENMDWCIVTTDFLGGVDIEAFPSFKAFLIKKAVESARDKTKEEGDWNWRESSFAYSCR